MGRCLPLAVIFCLASAVAAAQTKIIITNVLPSASLPASAAEDLTIDIDNAQLVSRQPSRVNGMDPGGFVPTPDASFLVSSYSSAASAPNPRLSVYGIGVRSMVTGERWMFELGQQYVDGAQANPLHPIVYFPASFGTLTVIDISGIRTWPGCPAGSNISTMTVALDGSVVYLACSTTLVTLDALSGEERGRVTLAKPPIVIRAVAGQRLFTIDDMGSGQMRMTLCDPRTGALFASADPPVPNRPLTWAVPTITGDQVVVGVRDDTSGFSLGSTPYVIDSASLATVRSLAVNKVVDAVFAHYGQRLVMLREVDDTEHVAVMDIYQNTLRDVQLGVRVRSPSRLTLIDPPLAPIASVSVAGQSATLTWSMHLHSMAASVYEILVGPAPILSRMTTLLTRPASSGTTLRVDGVPPGTYYVCVRGWNAAGVGLCSDMINAVIIR